MALSRLHGVCVGGIYANPPAQRMKWVPKVKSGFRLLVFVCCAIVMALSEG